MPSATLDLLAPAYRWEPEWDATLGPEVADMCASYGFAPDPEQRMILDAMFATSGGKSIRDIGICAPRQNLKTGVLKMAALGWLYLLELPLVVWSAHEYPTAQEAWRDLCMLIEDNPDLDREVLRTPRGKTGIKGGGDELIELKGNRRIKFKARTHDGGRGLTGDRVILDEAMKLQGGTIAALVPTLRAVPDPQLVFAGSAGLLESAHWRSVRDRGRPGGDAGLAWYEWGDLRPWECGSAECAHGLDSVDCALDDEDRLRACNSALGRRMTMDSLRADRRTFAAFPVKYATETLGWWEDPPDTDAIDDVLAGWAEAGTDASPTAPLALGIDVSADMRSAALVIYGAGVLDIADYRRNAGMSWVAGRVAELRQRHEFAAVGMAGNGPVRALRDDIPDVVVLNSAQLAEASVAFTQDINEGRCWHWTPPDRAQTALDVAVRAARRQLSGDGWRWSRRLSEPADISPLLAAVVARHLLTNRSDDQAPPNVW